MATLKKKAVAGKVVVLLGARRVGKTELIKDFLQEWDENDYLFLNGEDRQVVDVFEEQSIANVQRIAANKKLLVIDEAQKIPEIGQKLKLLIDHNPDIAVIATGSSMFDLQYKMGEPLVGRSWTLNLYPLAQMEFDAEEDVFTTKAKLEERLIFGGYPELLHLDSWSEKEEYLQELVSAYLLRDLLEFGGIRKSEKIMDLLRLIAFQVGNEVNIDELAANLKGISRNTIETYLDLLSKVFVIYKVPGFSRNLRKEVTKMSKWYFYDNGVRNAVINNFSGLKLRMDTGNLWENYLMIERKKLHAYSSKNVNQYFWRTYDQQELDLLEESAGQLNAFEFKYNPKKKAKVPMGFSKAYPEARFTCIDSSNYLDFITP